MNCVTSGKSLDLSSSPVKWRGLWWPGIRKCPADAQTEAQEPGVTLPLPSGHLLCSPSLALTTPSPDYPVSPTSTRMTKP